MGPDPGIRPTGLGSKQLFRFLLLLRGPLFLQIFLRLFLLRLSTFVFACHGFLPVLGVSIIRAPWRLVESQSTSLGRESGSCRCTGANFDLRVVQGMPRHLCVGATYRPP